MNWKLRSALGASALLLSAQALAQMEHRVQMSTPPGATIAVNQNGEPRG